MRIDSGGITLDVTDTGEGTPVLLLHGWPDTHELWRHQVAALTAAGYRTITPDLRGFGASGMPDDVAAYGIEHHLGDVLGVLDHLGIARAHLVGHDWGGAIAAVTAALVPDRFTSLTCLSVGHPGAFATDGFAQREKSWYMLLFQFPGVAEQWLTQDGCANFRAWSGHPEADDVAARWADPAVVTAGLGVYRAVMAPEALVSPPVEVPPITVPTLGLWSTGDMALTEGTMAGTAKFVDAPWRYERVEGAGHWLQLDAPDVVNRHLLDHLREVDG